MNYVVTPSLNRPDPEQGHISASVCGNAQKCPASDTVTLRPESRRASAGGLSVGDSCLLCGPG